MTVEQKKSLRLDAIAASTAIGRILDGPARYDLSQLGANGKRLESDCIAMLAALAWVEIRLTEDIGADNL